MRTLLAALLATCVVCALSACSMNKSQGNSNTQAQASVSGVLIDQACGAKMMTEADPEKAASGHPKSCATKDDCAASGYAVISGKEMIKFDDHGNQLAKDFLAKTDKTEDLRVNVEGVRTGDQIAVTSINAQ